MKKLELEKFGVSALNAEELSNVNGGVGWLKKLGWGYVVTQVIDHWDEIKQGVSDGWNAK